MTTSRTQIRAVFRRYFLNRYVMLVFSLPSLGYLGFLSRFVIGEPGGPIRVFLEAMFLFSLPVMHLYSIVLEVLPPVEQGLGTIGFFPFAYLVAILVAWVARQSLRVIRRRGLHWTDSNGDS